MRLSDKQVEHLQQLLDAHRDALHTRLQEQALDGPRTSPATVRHIREGRAEIARIKKELRNAEVTVNDLITDEDWRSTQQQQSPASIQASKAVNATDLLTDEEQQFKRQRTRSIYTPASDERTDPSSYLTLLERPQTPTFPKPQKQPSVAHRRLTISLSEFLRELGYNCLIASATVVVMIVTIIVVAFIISFVAGK